MKFRALFSMAAVASTVAWAGVVRGEHDAYNADAPALRALSHDMGLTGDWWGYRSQLDERGIHFEAAWVLDLSQNWHGGLQTRNEAFRHLFDANLLFDLEAIVGWQGASVFADFQTFNGRHGSEILTGDLQGFSNIDEADFTALYELWFEQSLLDDRVRLRVGKIDANGEFAYVDHGAEFINSSAGFSPTIVGLPTYPDPATGFNVFIYPSDNFYIGGGLYDGAAQEGYATGRRGPSTLFGPPADLFLIGEAGLKWQVDQPHAGRLGVGVWKHTGSFDRWDGGTENGTAGIYGVLDQMLWTETDGQGIGLFAQVGYADPDVSEIEWHLGAGLAWTGAIPTRDNDVTGVMASCVLLSDEARSAGVFSRDYELVIEAFYKCQVTPNIAIKPDIQYIANPGGGVLEDAVVATLRVELLF